LLSLIKQARLHSHRSGEGLLNVRNKTVTGSALVPVLVSASPGEEEGKANFLAGIAGLAQVRRLSEDDLDPETTRGKMAWDSLTSTQQTRFVHLVQLLEAIRKRDQNAIQQSYAQLLGPEAAIHWKNLMHKLPEDFQFIERLTELLTTSLVNLQFVLWRDGKRFVPALYCPDFATVLYLRVLLSAAGEPEFAICARCNQVFRRKRKDQKYCSIAHRDSARVDRWRDAKKAANER
jgi:hypothetical protein